MIRSTDCLSGSGLRAWLGRTRLALHLGAVLAVLLTCSKLKAQTTYYLDIGGVSNGSGVNNGGNYTWNTAIWTTTSTGGTDTNPAWNNPDGFSVVLVADGNAGTDAFTLTLPNSQAQTWLNNLTVNSGDPTIAVNGGNFVLQSTSTWNITAGSTLTISGNGGGSWGALNINGNSLIVTGAGNMVVNGMGNSTGGLTMNGTGNLQITDVSDYTGATTVNAGTLLLDFSNMATPTNILTSSALTLGGGTLSIKGKASGATAQTFSNSALTAGTESSIVLSPNGGTSTTLTLSSVTAGAGASLNFNLSAGTTNATTSTLGNTIVAWNPALNGSGIIGTGYTVTDGGGTGFATVSGGDVVRLSPSALTALPASGAVGTTNYILNLNTSDTVTPGSLTLVETASQSAGSLTVDTTAAAGTFGLGGTTLSTTGLSITGPNTLAITGTGALGTGGSTLNLHNNNAALVTVGTLVSGGAGGLTVDGTGTTVLTATNGYTGATSIGQGSTLRISGAGSLNSGNYGGAIANAGSLQFSSSAAQILSGVISGSGSLTLNGGSLILSGASNTYTGATTINAGTLVAGNGGDGVKGISGSSAVFLGNTSGSSAATLQLGNQSSTTYTNNITVQSGNSGLMTLNGSGFMMVNGTVTLGTAGSAGQSITLAEIGQPTWIVYLNGGIRDPTNLTGSPGAVTIGSGNNGIVEFTAANTYTGSTKVNGGTLELTNNLALQNSTLDTSGGGVITLSGVTTPTIGGLIGSANLASVITTGYGSVTALTLNPGTGVTDSYSGVIAKWRERDDSRQDRRRHTDPRRHQHLHRRHHDREWHADRGS